MLGRGEWRPFYSLERLVPAIPLHGNIDNRFWEDKGESPAKTQLVWLTGGVGRPPCAASGYCPSLVHCLVGPLLCTLVPGLCMSVFSVNWALFVSVMHDWIFCAFVLRLLYVLPYSAYGCLQSKNHQNLWKWLAISPITTFGGLNVKKRCRSLRLYF